MARNIIRFRITPCIDKVFDRYAEVSGKFTIFRELDKNAKENGF
jgi:hypothetical protein